MNYLDYMRAVKERGRFTTDEAAEKAIHAVLEILGQRITIGQAEDVAGALPAELRQYLRQSPGAEPLNLAEFLERVGKKEGVGTATAEEHSRAVLSVLAEWIPRAELRDTLEQIPSDMRSLFAWMKKAA